MGNDGGWFFGRAIEKIREKTEGAGGAEQSHEGDKNGDVHGVFSGLFMKRDSTAKG